MKKIRFLFLALALLIVTGCQNDNTSSNDGINIDPNAPLFVEHKVLENDTTPDGRALVYSPGPGQMNDEKYRNDIVNLLVDFGARPKEVYKLYSDLLKLEDPNSRNNQKVVKYLMNQDIFLIEAGRGEDALDLALQLDVLIPQDFYVQNRIIGSYRIIAEDQFKSGKLKDALETIQKARAVRFDFEATRTFIKIQFALVQKDIDAKKYQDAAWKLDDVYVITSQPENQAVFKDEAIQFEKFKQVISQHVKVK